jgi:hypothetical protein
MSNLLNKIIKTSRGLSNGDLENIGKKCLLNFLGVYPSDAMPRLKENKNFISVIFNLSPHYEDGSHFIAVVKTKCRVYLFDSLGKSQNYSITINKFLKHFQKPIIYCTIKIQTSTSIFCSLYCLSFILHMQKQNHYPAQFYKMFPRCVKKNDIVIQNYIVKEIKKIVC